MSQATSGPLCPATSAAASRLLRHARGPELREPAIRLLALRRGQRMPRTDRRSHGSDTGPQRSRPPICYDGAARMSHRETRARCRVPERARRTAAAAGSHSAVPDSRHAFEQEERIPSRSMSSFRACPSSEASQGSCTGAMFAYQCCDRQLKRSYRRCHARAAHALLDAPLRWYDPEAFTARTFNYARRNAV